MFEAYFETFLYKDVHKKTGMTFDEFIGRPRHEIESIVRVLDDFTNKKEKATKSIIDKLNKDPKNAEKSS